MMIEGFNLDVYGLLDSVLMTQVSPFWYHFIIMWLRSLV